MKRKMITVDGCTACALVAYATNELVTIYPITPSSPMAETCDALAAGGKVNLWGTCPMSVRCNPRRAQPGRFMAP